MAHSHDTIHDRPNGRGRFSGGGPLRLVAVLLVTLAIASAWLVFPYFYEGRQSLEDVSSQVMSERNAQHRTLGQILTRYAPGPGEAEVDVLYASDVYFQRTSTPRAAAAYNPDDYLVFIVNEGLHTGELPARLPQAELRVDGVAIAPADIEGPVDTDHHRTTVIRFAREDAAGRPILGAEAEQMVLRIANGWDEADTAREAVWDLPVDYPAPSDTLNSPAIIMAVAAGLLSVTLTPCLLQLIVVYMATLTGLSAEQVSRSGAVPAAARRQMLLNAVAFVVGFTVFYTLAGAVIGYAGKQAQLIFATYSREVAFATGVLVIAMGLWMGIKSRAPIVCRMPVPAGVRTSDKGGFLRSALLSAGFSLGCMVCFSGAIMATLFVYVGSLGSASTGAFILFMFSMGVAIPFLAAAFFLSRTMSVMQWISKYNPQIGFVSMIVIVAFGIVLITDQFHTVSDMIYPWLGLN